MYQHILAPLILRWDALLFFVPWTETLLYCMKWEITPPPSLVEISFTFLHVRSEPRSLLFCHHAIQIIGCFWKYDINVLISFPLLEKVLKFTKPIYCDGGGPVFEHLTDMGQLSVNKTMTVEFISVGGQAFREYAKSAEFGKGEILWYPESWNCFRLKTNFVHRLKLSIQCTENTQKIKFA